MGTHARAELFISIGVLILITAGVILSMSFEERMSYVEVVDSKPEKSTPITRSNSANVWKGYGYITGVREQNGLFYITIAKLLYIEDPSALDGYRVESLNEEGEFPISESATIAVLSDLRRSLIDRGFISTDSLKPVGPSFTETVSFIELLEKLRSADGTVSGEDLRETFHFVIQNGWIYAAIQQYTP